MAKNLNDFRSVKITLNRCPRCNGSITFSPYNVKTSDGLVHGRCATETEGATK